MTADVVDFDGDIVDAAAVYVAVLHSNDVGDDGGDKADGSGCYYYSAGDCC